MNFKRLTAGVAVTALITVGVSTSIATAAVTDHDVRQENFTVGTGNGYANSDTRSEGSFEFLKEGIRLKTNDVPAASPDPRKVAEYFPVNLPLSGVTNVDYQWFGTSPSPGIQYVMDFDNDGTQDGILVGEKVYGGTDVWLTNGSKDAYKGAGAPSNTGGSGTENHGDLAAWSAKYPNAKILFGGFSLGSGVTGDGVLRSISYGEDRYVFTDDDLPVEVPALTNKPVTGNGVFKTKNRKATFTMRTDVTPAGDSGKGPRIHWQIKVNGVQRYSAYNGWSSVTAWTWKFSTKGGSKKIVVLRNGVKYAAATVTTK